MLFSPSVHLTAAALAYSSLSVARSCLGVMGSSGFTGVSVSCGIGSDKGVSEAMVQLLCFE